MFVLPMTRHSHEFSRQLERQIERRLESLLQADSKAISLRSPALDVSETDLEYRLQLDLPGVSKEAVKITIDGRRITIDAEQAAVAEPTEGSRMLHRERAATRFSRSLTLPQEVNQGDSSAKLEHGVLTLTLVKRQASGASQLKVS
ncbi:Hsp20/alpha crystallin family protein [Paucibacter sp. DJ2R-2]|uniref:Hsp20/alpha crystallin family protein n=1 Tax=Paucibacter sp. DJ2R-2 TaxID=2893558 RepID=UPI0021E4B4F5|nr:Hsp20/alpha crystallin family protein [Paucibacter sp. DJ2R-2]MCV2420565.1 Hsp20/alpha crystallin family protein [Paucibacter sp. DJ4R-1]MCV2439743.1 Hsp20/alpha crystallin family protein [Paucibacter sp. DJ2R-2]